MNFQQKLDSAIEKNNSLLCVGLDPILEKLPENFQTSQHPFFEFNREIIDATADLVCCYKPNSAFYEALGEKGIGELKKTCDYIHATYPNVPIILDAKRGDLVDTNRGYAAFAFDYLNADAVTLHSYIGGEVLKPFLERKGKGCIIMCKNSNPDSGEFQNLEMNQQPLYQIVAKHFAQNWNYNNNVLLVVGATYPEELAIIRNIVGNMTLLVPGIGAQGGDMQKSLEAGMTKDKKGIILSTSRTILYAGHGEDFAEKAREKARELRDTINSYRNE